MSDIPVLSSDIMLFCLVSSKADYIWGYYTLSVYVHLYWSNRSVTWLRCCSSIVKSILESAAVCKYHNTIWVLVNHAETLKYCKEKHTDVLQRKSWNLGEHKNLFSNTQCIGMLEKYKILEHIYIGPWSVQMVQNNYWLILGCTFWALYFNPTSDKITPLPSLLPNFPWGLFASANQ